MTATDPVPGELPDPHTTAGKIADLERRRYEAVHAGSAAAVEKQHARGKLTARERIGLLLDEGSFTELDQLARHRAHDFGIEANRPYGDGVITGTGTIDGRPVAVYSEDFTVFGGSLGEVYGEKIVKLMDHALKTGCPVVGISDGGGARIQEGVAALGLFAEIFFRNTRASGVIPQVSLIMGPAAGGAVYSPAITDFTIMVEGTSHMFITGPDVIKTVTGEDVTFEELGGARAHAARSGVAHYQAADEQDAIEYARLLLSYLPSNNLEEPPALPAEPDYALSAQDEELDLLIPDSPNQPYDIHRVIETVLDPGTFTEVHEGFARNIVVGFGRVAGMPVGVVANQPLHLAGCLDIDASEKAARFVRTCDAFSVPVLTLRRRARLPARRHPGMGRHHPPRRQAAVRLRRGHRAQGHRHHPQGLRRRLRRHGLQAPRRRRQPRLAHRPDRRHGRRRRRQHPLPPRPRRLRQPRPAAPPENPGIRGHPRQPLHRRRARLRRRRHPPRRNPHRSHQGPDLTPHQTGNPPTQKTRQHTVVSAEQQTTWPSVTIWDSSAGNPASSGTRTVQPALES
jgi:acetyl-CoA carboxylase beta subunit